jgi:hypothetical protein
MLWPVVRVGDIIPNRLSHGRNPKTWPMLPQCRVQCGIATWSKDRTVSTRMVYNTFGQREVDGSGPRSPLRCNLAVFSKAFRAGPNFNIAEHSTKTGNLS